MNIPEHFSGDSLEIDVPVAGQDGEPFDLSAFTLAYHAGRKYRNDPTIDLTLGSGLTLIDPDRVRVFIPKGVLVEPGQWWHWIEVTQGTFQQTLWRGTITVAFKKAAG